MPALKIAVQTVSLRRPLRQALAIASQLGADAVEVDARTELRPADLSQTALRQVKKLLDDARLRVAAVGFPTRRGYDVADRLEQRIAGTKEALTMAWQLGAAVVVNHVGRIPADAAAPGGTQLVEALSDIGRFGHRSGATLAALTGSESGGDLARLIDALPDGSLAAALDPGNLIVNGFSPSEAVDALGRRIAYVQASDGTRDLARGRGIETPLGRGSADFPNLLGQLEQYDYRGYVTIRCRSLDNPVGELSAAIEYLRSL